MCEYGWRGGASAFFKWRIPYTIPELSSVPAIVILYFIWDLLLITVISADAVADPVISELL